MPVFSSSSQTDSAPASASLGAQDLVGRRQKGLHACQVAVELGVLVVGQLHSDGRHPFAGQVVAEIAGDRVAVPALFGYRVAAALRRAPRPGGRWARGAGRCPRRCPRQRCGKRRPPRHRPEIAHGTGLRLGERDRRPPAPGWGPSRPTVSGDQSLPAQPSRSVSALRFRSTSLAFQRWPVASPSGFMVGMIHRLMLSGTCWGWVLKVLQELLGQDVGVGLEFAMDVADQYHLDRPRADAVG